MGFLNTIEFQHEKKARKLSWHEKVKKALGRSRLNSSDYPEIYQSSSFHSIGRSRASSIATVSSSPAESFINPRARAFTHGSITTKTTIRIHEQKPHFYQPPASTTYCHNCTKQYRTSLSPFTEFCSLDCKSAFRLRQAI